MYFLRPDTVTGRSDVYVLYRRVNSRDSTQVVRGIHVPADSAFFSYYVPSADSLARVATATLPLYWDSTSIANVRAVGLRVGGFFRNRVDGADVIRTVQWRTVLPAIVTGSADCGAAPSNPAGVAVSLQTGSTSFHVRVSWNRSSDDGAGASDVRTYLVTLRVDTVGAPRRVVATIPARGVANYRYEHHFPNVAGTVKYGIQAVDCGHGLSGIVEHNSNLTLP